MPYAGNSLLQMNDKRKEVIVNKLCSSLHEEGRRASICNRDASAGRAHLPIASVLNHNGRFPIVLLVKNLSRFLNGKHYFMLESASTRESNLRSALQGCESRMNPE